MSPLPRFDGAAAWAALTQAQQAEIGAIGLEIVAAWEVADRVDADGAGRLGAPWRRLDDASLLDDLREAFAASVPLAALTGRDGVPRIPSRIGRVCHTCGCTDDRACPGGCSWAAPDLCSACVSAGDAA